jgi:hypothetical protein
MDHPLRVIQEQQALLVLEQVVYVINNFYL